MNSLPAGLSYEFEREIGQFQSAPAQFVQLSAELENLRMNILPAFQRGTL